MTYFNLEVGSKLKTGSVTGGKGEKVGSLSMLSDRLGEASSTELQLPMCVTCSAQTSYNGKDLEIESEDSTYKCPICLDPRQYIGTSGQKWTTLQSLILNDPKGKRLYNDFEELIPGSLWTFKTRPAFGIGQRAFLLKDSNIKGVVMWDCVAYIDDDTLEKIDEISDHQGISHMIVSHPHYYSTTATWTAAFPAMKLWLAKVDFHAWYPRSELLSEAGKEDGDSDVASRIRLVDEEQTSVDVDGRVKILLLGGHFPGSLVLLWKDILFIADTIQVVPSGLYKSDQPQRPNVASFTFLWR